MPYPALTRLSKQSPDLPRSATRDSRYLKVMRESRKTVSGQEQVLGTLLFFCTEELEIFPGNSHRRSCTQVGCRCHPEGRETDLHQQYSVSREVEHYVLFFRKQRCFSFQRPLNQQGRSSQHVATNTCVLKSNFASLARW